MTSNTQQFVTLHSYPRAIVCIDADAFFASVEQAVHPEYRGKPVVTGAERGIIAAASYEAKALGVKRGLSLWDARKLCPELIVLPTDYETCSLFSKRMFDIMREFTPQVEEYSMDEGFADLTGLRRMYRKPYEEIAHDMHQRVNRDLGITVSLGLSLSKGLAKICSAFRKPNGFTAVPGKYIHILLQRTPLGDVWGMGPSNVSLLHKYRIHTAYDFIQMEEILVKQLLGKLGTEMWHELRGESMLDVSTAVKKSYQSVSKFKTFTPPVADREQLRSFLLRNVESACIKIRRYHLAARKLYVTLRTQQFDHLTIGTDLSRATASPLELSPIVDALFASLFKPGDYRATGVVLADLIADDRVQMQLFDSPIRMEKIEKLSGAIDELSKRFGKHTLHLASTLPASQQHQGGRAVQPERKENILKGETARRHLKYSFAKINS